MNRLVRISLLCSIMFLMLIVSGCGKKETPQETPKISKDTIAVVDTAVVIDTTKKEQQVPDIKGTYTGTFDKRPTTLKITSQNGTSFTGNITINYRQVINQQVKGKFNDSTMTYNMSDQIHSRFQGSYAGKFSSNFKSMSGTFTMSLDKSKFSFNLTKK